MWVLLFFQILNNNVTHYQLGQYSSEKICMEEMTKASVLVTTNNIALYCFEVINE
jgi:hypothetical protein